MALNPSTQDFTQDFTREKPPQSPWRHPFTPISCSLMVRRGVRAAERQGLRVTGTLGVLDLAAERGLLDFAQAIQFLEATTFRRPMALLETLLLKHKGSGNK